MSSSLAEFKNLEIKLEDIESATNNFDESKVIGIGGFGKVYIGELAHSDGRREVAVKRLVRKHGQGDPEFLKEILMLSSYKHENIISLLGFCNEKKERILVYEYASGGSLDRLLNKSTLTWKQRIKICLDAAKGLCFLHEPHETHQIVFHCDIKSGNILLDANMNAKLSDFGLSKTCPADEKNTFIITDPVGTLGYCDPLPRHTYYLTTKLDVYSFGVVLYEVLCGKLCFDKSGNVFVSEWKKSYDDKKLNEIIFQDLMPQTDPDSLETFAEIANSCLDDDGDQRPDMYVVVQKLERALELQEFHDMHPMLPKNYLHIARAAVGPLKYESLEAFNSLLSKGVFLDESKTWFFVKDNGEHCGRIYIEGCLDQKHTQNGSLIYVDDNSRFPGGSCYSYERKFITRVRCSFMSPHITYRMNLVFRSISAPMKFMPIRYILDGQTKIVIVDKYEDKREDGWFTVELYQLTSNQRNVELEIVFEDCMYTLQVAGFEFLTLEEKVVHDQVLDYQEIVKAASHYLVYRSAEELKVLLYKGIHLNWYKTWFQLDDNEKQCEMISIVDCLIPDEYPQYQTHPLSRFPAGFYQSRRRGFKTYVKTQFLSPKFRYKVSLVFYFQDFSKKQEYIHLRYKLEGETKTSIVYLANRREDELYMAELYLVTSEGKTFDLMIVFEEHTYDIQIEGILFQPHEKVEQEQVLEDESLHWTMDKHIFSSPFFWLFVVDKGDKCSSVNKNGKKGQILSARGVIDFDKDLAYKYHELQWRDESRFGRVLVIHNTLKFFIARKIEIGDELSPETLYACYLVYKLQEGPSSPITLKVSRENDYWHIFLLTPPCTPFIGNNDENTHKPLLCYQTDLPKQRRDGWMEVKVCEFETLTTSSLISLDLVVHHAHAGKEISGLIIEGIEFRAR